MYKMKSWFLKMKFKKKLRQVRQKEQKTNILHSLWRVKQKKKGFDFYTASFQKET